MKRLPGTVLRSVDLHVHTPASRDFKDPTASARDVLQAASRAELDAIAITDHNSIEWIEKLRTASKAGDVIIFPGFELNANGGHLLAIFDPSISIEVLETALIECGIPKQHWGEEAFVGCSLETALEVISKNGGLGIGAHAEKGKGFLVAISQGAARQRIYNNEHLAALEAHVPKELEELIRSSGKGFSRKIAVLENSDAHSLSEIGSRFTRIRMDHLSIEGLRQAFVDPEVKVRLSSSPVAPDFPFIESLEVDRGFLKGQKIVFNNGLNCLVGSAGTGKSTVIEFLRFVLDQISSIDTVSTDCYGKLADLAGTGSVLKIVVSLNRDERYEISRVYDNTGNPVTIARLADGKEVGISDLRKFFPIHAFSQGEVVSICRSPLAQLELVDRHLEIEAYIAEIRKAQKNLDKQALQIAKDEEAVSVKPDIEGELADLKTKIAMLSKEMANLKESKKNVTLLSHPLWQEEEAYWQAAEEGIVTTKETIEESFDTMDLQLLQLPIPEEQTPNKSLILRNQEKLAALETARERAKGLLLKSLEQAGLVVEKNAKTWKLAFQKHKSKYSKISANAKTERLAEASEEIGKARRRAQALRGQLISIGASEKHLKNAHKERDRLLKLVTDNRTRIRALRERKAKQIVKQTSQRIALKYVANGNRSEYEDLLTNLLRGSHAQRPTVEAISANVLPSDLVRMAKAKDIKKLDSETEVGSKWAVVIVDRLIENPIAMYKVQAVPLEDRLDISLKVAEGEYKPLSKLSTGQKATVIVLLTMVEGSTPIIFDQPEDALYTPFIYSDIVRTLRSGKENRQFILATHNPNIAIGADTDLGIVLEGTASQASIQSAGGLDDNDTRGLLLLHLEGGEKAFKSRHVKFGIK